MHLQETTKGNTDQGIFLKISLNKLKKKMAANNTVMKKGNNEDSNVSGSTIICFVFFFHCWNSYHSF